MAPLHIHQHHQRSINSGTTFTIVFTTLACVVMFSCFIWGFVVPYFRKRRIQSNCNLSGRSGVSIYDPRFETPFPAAPSESDSIMLESMTSPRIANPATSTSQNLVTPIRDRNVSHEDQHIPRLYTLPRVRSRSEIVRTNVNEEAFGDARDYIVALPEPLRLRSRTYSDKLAASGTFEQPADYSELSGSFDKTVHPNKLFERLDSNNPRGSNCSIASTHSRLTVAEPPRNNVIMQPEADHNAIASQHIKDDDASSIAGEATASNDVEEPSCSTESEPGSTRHNASIAAMHRLRTYRSLVGAPPPEPLSRAGTLTRPKTPVAIMRDIYDRSGDEGEISKKPISRNDTISTLFRNFAGSSDNHSNQSSQSSPLKTSPETFTASALDLVPTPLNLSRDEEQHALSSKRNSRFREELELREGDKAKSTEAYHDDVQEKEGAQIKIMKSKPPSSHRPRPHPLDIPRQLGTSALLGSRKGLQSPSLLHGFNRTPQSSRPYHNSAQASSIYSSDTQGMSVGLMPGAPDSRVGWNYTSKLSPGFPSTIGAMSGSDRECENLIRKENDAVDEVNQKVEKWNADVDTANAEHVDINFNTSPSPSLKHALSSLGPDCHSTHDVSEYEVDHRHSTISTELAPSEARLSSIAGPVTISDFADASTVVDQYEVRPGRSPWF